MAPSSLFDRRGGASARLEAVTSLYGEVLADRESALRDTLLGRSPP